MADPQRRIKTVKADWSDVVLVCRKCSKKLGGGFGRHGDTPLGKALARELARSSPSDDIRTRKRRRRALLVLEVGCQDLCPKQAVVACRPGTPHRWLIVPRGMPIPAVAAELGISPGAPDGGTSGTPAAPGTGIRTDRFAEDAPDAASPRADR